MANQPQSRQSNNVNTFVKGINTDLDPIKQPDGSYRFALNVSNSSSHDNNTDRNSDESNASCFVIKPEEILKGTQLLDNNDKIHYIYNRTTGKSIISLQKNNTCDREDLIITSCFNWDDNRRIQSVFKLFKGCERVLYFTDGNNPVFTVNIDDLINYVSDNVYDIYGDNINNDVAVEYANSDDLWNCELFNLISSYRHPNIQINELLNSGGNIEVGSYQFSIRYLDNDLNPTDWISITNPVPVLDENTNSRYFEIDGGIAGDNTDNTVTGDTSLPPTTKSIQLRLSNLDTNYNFYQIAVIQTSGNTGTTTDVYLKPEVQYSGDTSFYTFTGKNLNDDIAATESEITSVSTDINSANHILQKDNRLLLANTKSNKYDWSKFQIAASKIGSKYKVNSTKKTDFDQSVKSPNYYYNIKNYMRDEVYAFGIVWILKNGRETPAFHIPGRPLNWDPVNNTPLDSLHDNLLINGFNDTNYDHLPDDLQNVHARWVSENTAIKLSDDEGLMGYHQSLDHKYPVIRNCDNKSIWGQDIKGEDLEGEYIRHHRFPDATLEKIQDLVNIYNLGVEFFNIEPPAEYADDIQGYRIVRDIRTEVNKTVLDNGILDSTLRIGIVDYSYFRSGTSLDSNATTSDKIFVYHSPKGYFNREALTGNHFKIIGHYNDSSVLNQTYANQAGAGDFDVYFMWGELDSTTDGTINKLLTDYKYVDRRSVRDVPATFSTINVDNLVTGGGVTETVVNVINHLGSNDLLFISLDDTINSPENKLYYVSHKSFRDVYTNLFSLRYINTHPNIESVTQSSIEVYGGDSYISKIDWSLQDYDTSRTYMTAYIESEINSELRHDGDEGVCSLTYKGPYFQDELNDITTTDVLANIEPIVFYEWILRYARFNDPSFEDSGLDAKDFVCADYWALNPDLIRLNNQRQYRSIPLGFNYCSRCLEEYPYRIYYSEKSFQEENIDNYRVFLINNYTDIMGDQGPITNMFLDRDRLFVHCNKAIWQVQTRPNEIRNSEETIFVGTGEIFSIPPRQLVSTDYGYGGSNQKWSTVSTEHGTFFCDSNLGKVFLMGSGLEEISAYGMINFFERNLEIELIKQVPEFNNRDALNHNSIGVIATYDTRYKRYILHKKDFTFTDKMRSIYKGVVEDVDEFKIDFQLGEVGNTPTVLFESEFTIYSLSDNNFYYVDQKSNTYNKIDFRNKEYFVNLSWTLSYDPIEKNWISFHSYMPTYMFMDNETFYSYVDGMNNIYKHNIIGDYLNYYGIKYPMVIEIVEKGNYNNDHIFSSFKYISSVEKYDSQQNSFIEISDKTFDEYYAFTRDQITSTNSIVIDNIPYLSISQDRNIAIASRVDNGFRVSKNLRDIAINRNNVTLTTSNWLINDYNIYFNQDGFNNGYIDYVPNPNGRDINKEVYSRSKIKDKYMRIRLFFKPSDNLRMSLQLSTTTNRNKNR